MRRCILPIAFAIALAACNVQPGATDGQSSSASSEAMQTMQTGRFSVRYPSDWTKKSNVTMPEAGYDMLGTRLTYPAEKDHTTLSDAAVFFAFGKECPWTDLIDRIGKPKSVTIGGREWYTYPYADAGAGNLYQGNTYARMETDGCYMATTLLHSCNLGPDCAADHTRPFDKDAMIALFDQVLSTFAFKQ